MKGLRQRPVAAGRRSRGQPDPGDAGEGGKQPRRSRDGSTPLDGPGPVSKTEGVREEPVPKPLKSSTGPKPSGHGPERSACPSRATPKPVDTAGHETMRKDCGVLVVMLQGQNWAPTRRSVHGERGNAPEVALPAGRPGWWWAGACSAVDLGSGRSPRSSPRLGKPATWRRRVASSQCRKGMSGARR
jgi:hypothetical protein